MLRLNRRNRLSRLQKKSTKPANLRCESLEDRRLLAVVTSEAELNAAIAANDPSITFANNITLTDTVVVDINTTIDGAGFTLSGDGSFRVLLLDSGTLPCDLDGDGDCDIDDLDMLCMDVVNGNATLADVDQWLSDASPFPNPYLPGDANLDGIVDGSDFIIWNTFKFGANGGADGGRWSRGDFNCDNIVDGQDFIIWNTFKFQNSFLRNGGPGEGPVGVDLAQSLNPTINQGAQGSSRSSNAETPTNRRDIFADSSEVGYRETEQAGKTAAAQMSREFGIDHSRGGACGQTVAINNLTVTGGGGVGAGAGIASNATLTMTGSTVTGNTALETDPAYIAIGGGILTNCSLTLDDTDVTQNTATTSAGNDLGGLGGGIGAETSNSSITLQNGSTVTGNVAKDSGGGISARLSGSVTINNSTVSNNSAGVGVNAGIGTDGGGIFILGAGPDGAGGTLYFPMAVSISGSMITGNNLNGVPSATANVFPYGGGLYANGYGSVSILNTMVTGNSAPVVADNGANASLSRGAGMAVLNFLNYGGPSLNLLVVGGEVSGNYSRQGAGILTRASSQIEGTWNNVTISNNTAWGGSGGGWWNWGVGTYTPGLARQTVNDSMITGNSATLNAAGTFASSGGMFNLASAEVTFNNTALSNNYATSRAGAIRNGGFGETATAAFNNGSTVSNNYSPVFGGAYTTQNGTMVVNDSTISGNSGPAFGGGINNAFGGTLTINNSKVNANYSAGGGAGVLSFTNTTYYNGGTYVNDSRIYDNYDPSGGAGALTASAGLTYAGTVKSKLTISNSDVSNNLSYGFGAGVYAYDGDLTIFQSTLSGNNGVLGSAVASRVTGSYVGSSQEAVVVIDRATIANNVNGNSAVYADQYGNATITNSLISGNATTLGSDVFGLDATKLTLDHSLMENNTGGGYTNGAGNILGSAATLGSLALNGNTKMSFTHALLSGSLGINAATAGAGAGETRDQRENYGPRVVGGTMDMGAFEYGATVASATRKAKVIAAAPAPASETRFEVTDRAFRQLGNLNAAQQDLGTRIAGHKLGDSDIRRTSEKADDASAIDSIFAGLG